MTLILGEALTQHRQQHACDALRCDAYLDLARQAVTIRRIPSAPRMAHWRLSVREARLPAKASTP